MTAAKKRPAKKAAAKRPAKKYELKTKPTPVSVDQFIDAVANETRRRDARTLLALMKKVTGEPAKMWGPSIVGFGSYHYKYDSGHEGDMCMAGFSPRGSSLVVYIVPKFLEYEPLLARLGKHRHGVSCLYINKLADIDMKTLEQLLVKSVAHMQTRRKA